MPDIHQFPAPPLPRPNPGKSVGLNTSPTRAIMTYGSRRTHLAPAKPTDTRTHGNSENYSEGMAGSSSSATQAQGSDSSSLTPPPGSQNSGMRVDEVDEEVESEEEMALDGEDEDIDEDRTNGAESSAGRSDAGGSEVGMESEWSDDDDSAPKVVLHVEARRVPRRENRNPHSDDTLAKTIGQYIRSMEDKQVVGTDLDLKEWGNEPVMRNVDKVFFAETEPASETFDPSDVEIRWHIYQPSAEIDLEQFTAVTEDDDEGDAVPAASVRDLPAMELEGIWENLIYSTDLKPRLLRYINSTMTFSDAQVDFNKVSWNRLVLLHGPPGTGKTSLCRALAQKLLVRMGGTYRRGKLVEINSHSLFSKWFSESGKLVQKLFSRVTEMVDDQQTLVVVMIDEVESLTAARSAAVNGSEPSDALRVVNALLTQLDKLKTRPNVLVMTTSNIPDTIDSAFIDRADEKFFVDYPPPEAVYWILKGCLAELAEKGMMRPCAVSTVQEVRLLRLARKQEKLVNGEEGEERKGRLRGKERADEAGVKLWAIALMCYEHNLAGRFLRRLPLLAHSHYLSVTTKKDDDGQPMPRSIEKWLDAFSRVVHDEIADRARIGKKTNTTMANGHSEESKG